LTIKNNGSTPINGWTLSWTLPNGQAITNMWGGTHKESGSTVTVTSDSSIPANGGTQTFSYNISYSGSNAQPTSFVLNGIQVGKPKSDDLKYNDEGLPILMYHHVASAPSDGIYILTKDFREQMQYLKDNGYKTLTMAEAYSFFAENKPVPRKSVVLTFDDGYQDSYTDAFPILKEFGFKATLFMIKSFADSGSLKQNQLIEMDKNGFDVESHSDNTDYLTQYSYETQLTKLEKSKAYLENALNKKVEFFAYPNGQYNDDSIKALQNSGYKMAVIASHGTANKSNGIYTLYRTPVNNTDNLQTFIGYLS
jgi:peptidoglycan/xylan/chitin deacetylase (PgdA/CDA1 family)